MKKIKKKKVKPSTDTRTPILLRQAIQVLERGDFNEAQQRLEAILKTHPNHAEALSFLGILYEKKGEVDKGIPFALKAVSLDPNYGYFYYNLGIIYRRAGMYQKALEAYDRALKLNVQKDVSGAIYTNIANVYYDLDTYHKAITYYKQALKTCPNDLNLLVNLANAFIEVKQHDQAIHLIKRIIARTDKSYGSYLLLAKTLINDGMVNEACQYLAQVARDYPNSADAFAQIGSLFFTMNRVDRAVQCLKRALTLDPKHLMANILYGKFLSAQERPMLGIAMIEDLLRVYPQNQRVKMVLGLLYAGNAREKEALVLLKSLGTMVYEDPSTVLVIGRILASNGHYQEGRQEILHALNNRYDPCLEIARAIMTVPLPSSTDMINEQRKTVIQDLQTLLEKGLSAIDSQQVSTLTHFFLAYQGQNDRWIMETLCKLYRQALPDKVMKCKSPPPRDKIKIAFFSRHFFQHTIAKLMQGIISHLPRDRFHITILSLVQSDTEIAKHIKEEADDYFLLHGSEKFLCKDILNLELDILFYSDIGMDPTSYLLALNRLAPVQCVTWGHPVTTGLDTLDYFISSEDLEIDEAQDHYSEKLLKLSVPPCYYKRPELQAVHLQRSDFGLADDDHLYIMPQTLFKIHPDCDLLLGNILEIDPKAKLLFLKGRIEQWSDFLLTRWEKVFPQFLDRVIFLPLQSSDRFMRLIELSDVMLDTLHFGGGNTNYEAFVTGTPIVTMPSKYMRSRVAYACYKRMGVLDCICDTPESYVNKAVQIATDKEYRQKIKEKILKQSSVIYEDQKVIDELSDFFVSAVEEARNRELIPHA